MKAEKKITRRMIVSIFLVALLALQFVPSRLISFEDYDANNILDANDNADKAVSTIMKTQCMDCHSSTLIKPWYYKIKPLTFWIDHHIKEGREHVNFDDWHSLGRKDQVHMMEECIEEVEEEHMPLRSYTYIHPKMTREERDHLIAFFKKCMETSN
jgi:hypothetical protein